jgi:hypothetical protein
MAAAAGRFGTLRDARCSVARLAALSVALAAVCVGGRTGAQQGAGAQQGSGEAQPAAGPGVALVSGVVTDSDSAAIAGAQVRLTSATGVTRQQMTSPEGRYAFQAVPGGTYTLRATAAGFGEGSLNNVVIAAGARELPPLMLQPAAHATVDAITQQQQAEIEIHQEEQQRLLGALPNFFVSYNWHAQPLTTRQKFELAWKTSFDPVNTGVNFGIAGIEQADGALKGYGPGAAGYFSRFGAAEGDLIGGTYVGGAILPALLHQDPRYFYKGTGSIASRALYALSTAVICRGDNGKWQVSYSGIGGDIASGALSNLYYPKTDRHGASLIVRNGLIDAGMDGVGNLVQEFVTKHVTMSWHRNPPTTPAAAPAPANAAF